MNATCNTDWCTSPDSEGGYDCYQWRDERCSCAQGRARLDGGFYWEGNWLYSYTCCTDGEAVGPLCGYMDPTLTHPESRMPPTIMYLMAAGIFVAYSLFIISSVCWVCRWQKLAKGVPTSSPCARPPSAVDVTSEPHACCRVPGYSGVSAASMDPSLEPYMSRQEFQDAFEELTRQIRTELDCRPWHLVVFWIPMVLTWPAGGFLLFILLVCTAHIPVTAIHGRVIGPLCAKAGLTYVIIPPHAPDGYGSPGNPGIVRFFLPPGARPPAASALGAQVVGIPVQPLQPMPDTPMAGAVAVAIPQPQQMQVVVPAGVQPGMYFVIVTPSGQQMQVMCPPDVAAGSTIAVTV